MTCYGRPGGRPALLQVRTVDRAVDRSSDPWGCVCVHVPRSTGPYDGRQNGRPTDGPKLSVWDGRPASANGQKYLKTGRLAGRPWETFLPNG